jgi:hypothetical protein
MPVSRKKSVTQLAAERQKLWDIFNSKTVSDEAFDRPLIKKVEAVEARLVKATFNTSADKLAGFRILRGDENPHPDGWCTFKKGLLERMMEFA